MQFPPRLARFAFLSVPILRTKDQAVFGQRLHFCENGDRCRRDPGRQHSLEAVLELAKGAPPRSCLLQRMSLFLAQGGHGAMSHLSPLCGQ
jgi:hypothetical protein